MKELERLAWEWAERNGSTLDGSIKSWARAYAEGFRAAREMAVELLERLEEHTLAGDITQLGEKEVG